jgi:hypothetical protein
MLMCEMKTTQFEGARPNRKTGKPKLMRFWCAGVRVFSGSLVIISVARRTSPLIRRNVMTTFSTTSVHRAAALALFAVVGAEFPLARPLPPKTAPVRKVATPAKKAPKLIREVLGTTQLQGYEGRVGETFTWQKHAFQLHLRSAEYRWRV